MLLADAPFPSPIYTEHCTSTNAFIEEHPQLFKKNFQAVWCGEQTQGKGRHNRSWQMQVYKDLAFSLVYFPPLSEQRTIFSYTLSAGMALAQALKTYTNQHVIKWPNDIMAAEKKLAGILCQNVTLQEKPALVVGIGINVNSDEKVLADNQRSISLKSILKTDSGELKLPVLLHDILFSLSVVFNDHRFPFSRQWQEQWLKLCGCQGKRVQVRAPVFAIADTMQAQAPHVIEGTMQGIDSHGHLLLQTNNGRVALQEGTLRFIKQ